MQFTREGRKNKTMSLYPECIRCGLCCIIEPCCFGKLGEDMVCSDLFINDDSTTTCLNKKAIIEYSGSFCVYICSKKLYKHSMKFY